MKRVNSWIKRLRLVLLLTGLVTLALALLGFQAQPYPPTLCEALELLGTVALIEVAVGAIIAAAVEYWAGWASLAPKAKRPILFAFCLVVPLGSLGLRVLFCGAAVDQNVIYLATMAGLEASAAFMGSQMAHIYKLPSK